MTKVGRLHLLTLLALPFIVLTLFACGGNGDTSGDGPTAAGADETSRAGSPATTPVAETRGGAELTAEEYAEAMEEVFTLGDDEIEAAFGDFLFNGVFSQDEAERIGSLEASDSWSDDDVEFASEYAVTLLQAVTGLYDLVVRISNEIVDELSGLRPPEHLSDLHSSFVAALGEVTQFLQAQVATVKNADTEIKNRQELADFQAVVNSLESGSADPDSEQKAEELVAQGDAACLSLKSQLETELGREVSLCGN